MKNTASTNSNNQRPAIELAAANATNKIELNPGKKPRVIKNVKINFPSNGLYGLL